MTNRDNCISVLTNFSYGQPLSNSFMNRYNTGMDFLDAELYRDSMFYLDLILHSEFLSQIFDSFLSSSQCHSQIFIDYYASLSVIQEWNAFIQILIFNNFKLHCFHILLWQTAYVDSRGYKHVEHYHTGCWRFSKLCISSDNFTIAIQKITILVPTVQNYSYTRLVCPSLLYLNFWSLCYVLQRIVSQLRSCHVIM